MNLYDVIDTLQHINKNELSIGDYLLEANSVYSDSHIYEVIELFSGYFVAKIIGSVDENGINNNHYKFYDGENYFDFEYNSDFLVVVPKNFDSIIKKVLVFS